MNLLPQHQTTEHLNENHSSNNNSQCHQENELKPVLETILRNRIGDDASQEADVRQQGQVSKPLVAVVQSSRISTISNAVTRVVLDDGHISVQGIVSPRLENKLSASGTALGEEDDSVGLVGKLVRLGRLSVMIHERMIVLVVRDAEVVGRIALPWLGGNNVDTSGERDGNGNQQAGDYPAGEIPLEVSSLHQEITGILVSECVAGNLTHSRKSPPLHHPPRISGAGVSLTPFHSPSKRQAYESATLRPPPFRSERSDSHIRKTNEDQGLATAPTQDRGLDDQPLRSPTTPPPPPPLQAAPRSHPHTLPPLFLPYPQIMPIRLTPLSAVPRLPYPQNWILSTIAVITSLSPVTSSHLAPPSHEQRTARLAHPSTSKRVHLTVFLRPREFCPSEGETVLLIGLKNHTFDGGSVKKYGSDGGDGDRGLRWWIGETELFKDKFDWCRMEGERVRDWWRVEIERERETWEQRNEEK